MPRHERCLLPGFPCHITQRGVSAVAHVSGRDQSGLLDMEWWKREAPPTWEQLLRQPDSKAEQRLRGCTYAGRPFGDEDFVKQVGEQLGRTWVRGRPRKNKPSRDAVTKEQEQQFSLW